MNRLRIVRSRLVAAAKVTTGLGGLGAGVFYLQTRNCQFETFNSQTDAYFFNHELFGQSNPWKKPYSADSCVRQVPFESLDPSLVEDARNGGSQLIERFTQGLWGGLGYAVQRRVMEFTKNEANRDDVWSTQDLLRCKYDPGTYVTNHFVIISKTPTSIFMRGCFDPHQFPVQPRDVDNVVEIRADCDFERKLAVLRLRVATFDGTKEASDFEDPFGGFAGWLHRRYSTALVESGARNCMA